LLSPAGPPGARALAAALTDRLDDSQISHISSSSEHKTFLQQQPKLAKVRSGMVETWMYLSLNVLGCVGLAAGSNCRAVLSAEEWVLAAFIIGALDDSQISHISTCSSSPNWQRCGVVRLKRGGVRFHPTLPQVLQVSVPPPALLSSPRLEVNLFAY
jgi:hypothetical protein